MYYTPRYAFQDEPEFGINANFPHRHRRTLSYQGMYNNSNIMYNRMPGVCSTPIMGVPEAGMMGSSMMGPGMMGPGMMGPRVGINGMSVYAPTRRPYTTFCPYCNLTITTLTRYRLGRTALGSAALFSLLCLCFIPLCCGPFKDVAHYCPNCYQQVSIFVR